MSPEETILTPDEANMELEERKMFAQNAERIEKMIEQIMQTQGIGRGKAKKALVKMHKQQMKILNKRIQANAHLPKQQVDEVVEQLANPIIYDSPVIQHVETVYPKI